MICCESAELEMGHALMEGSSRLAFVASAGRYLVLMFYESAWCREMRYQVLIPYELAKCRH